MGVDAHVRETFHSALFLSEQVLTAMNIGEDETKLVLDIFQSFDEKHLRALQDFEGDEQAFIEFARQHKTELDNALH